MENTKEKDHKDVHEGESLVTYWAIYILLMVLLVITVVAAEKDLSHYFSFANAFLAMVIAVIKATLVILFFMHVRHGTKLIWIVVSAGFFWLCIFFAMSFVDYAGVDNGNRHAGNQAGLTFPVSESPRPDQHFYNPLSPMVP